MRTGFARILSIAVLLAFCGLDGAVVVADDTTSSGEPAFPDYTGYVTDTADILDAGDVARLDALAADVQAKTTAQIAIVTVRSVKPLPVDEYAVALFERWGVGQREKDNGILIVVAVDDHEAWIQTGYGLEGAVPDAIAHRIYLETLVPAFRADDYGGGLYGASVQLARLIAKEYGVSLDSVDTTRRVRARTRSIWVQLGPLFWLLLLLLLVGRRNGLLWLLLASGGFGGRGRYGGGGFGGGFGGFGGGGGGGGFGGFGGGSTGGGGAGGSW